MGVSVSLVSWQQRINILQVFASTEVEAGFFFFRREINAPISCQRHVALALLNILLRVSLASPRHPFPPPARCRKMDRLSKSDPFVVVKWKTDTDEDWREVGERERAWHTHVILHPRLAWCSWLQHSTVVVVHSSPSPFD